MNDMEKILYDRYLDFWAYIYDIEKEEIKSLIKYTKYINDTLTFPYSANGYYNEIKEILMKKHLDYLDEAISNILQGNYNSLSCTIRIIIENYITFYLINKYKKYDLWKYWYVYGAYKVFRIIDHEPGRSIAKKAYLDMCESFEINDVNIFDMQSYSWLKKVKKLKNYNFKQACNLVDSNLYKDFNYLSERIHNNNVIFKTFSVDMKVFSKYIYTLYDITDKTIRLYDHRYLRRYKYKSLCQELLESLDTCLNYNENFVEELDTKV